MSSDSVKDIIQIQIEQNTHLTPDEKLALGRELESASNLNGQDGNIGKALKDSIYGHIVFRMGEGERIQKIAQTVVDTHAGKCKFKEEGALFGSLTTKWGRINGLSLALLVIVAGILAYEIGPTIARIWVNKPMPVNISGN